VDTDESGRFAFEVAADQRDVLVVVDVAGVGDHAEVAVAGGENSFGDAADVALVLHAVANQVGNGQHLQIVLLTEFMELRHAGHGAVFVHNFADDPAGVEAGDAGKVDAGFGLAGADEDAAIAGAERENVTGAGKILGASLLVDGGEDGNGAVGGADAGGDADAAVNGFGEGGTVDAGIDGRHEWEVEFFTALLGEREADEAAAELGHKVDGFGSNFLGGQGKVAFVFAVFVVDEDDHAALADFFDGFFYGGESGLVRSHGVLWGIV